MPQTPAGNVALATAASAAQNKWLVLATVGIGTFLAVLDSTIVSVLLPVMTTGLQTDLITIQWVIMGYLLVITGLLLSFGRLADLIGRKPVYVSGLAIFAVGVGLCGLAQSVEQLIAARVFEGIGAAMVMAIGPALTASAFPPNERGKALGINATIVASGGILGPVIGGLLADAFDWRSTFFFRMPFILLAMLLAVKFLARDRGTGQRRFDFVGGALLFTWLVAFTFGLNQGRSLGWASPTILVLLGTAFLGFIAFVFAELRAREPMLELSLFRIRLFTAASASSLISFMTNFGVAFLMPFYLIQVMGYSVRDAGMMTIPQPLLMSLAGPLSGILSDHIGSRILSTAGMGLGVVALISLAMLDQNSSQMDVLIRVGLFGLAKGIFQSPNSSALLSSVPASRLGTAAGMQALMRNLGMVLGTAVFGAVWTSRMAFHTDILAALGNLAPQALSNQAFIFGFRDALLVSAGVCLIGVFTSLVRAARHPQA